MVAPPSDEDASAVLQATFGDLELRSLSPPMRGLLNSLLLYKSVFVGPWFEMLIEEERAGTRETYIRLRDETAAQAKQAVRVIEDWGSYGDPRAREVTDNVLTRVLEDMLTLKKSSTEVFLAAGLAAPTDEIRRRFLQLADIDRGHASALRSALGVRQPGRSEPRRAGGGAGVEVGPFPGGTLPESLKTAVDRAREHGDEPERILLSSLALRHLRDAGVVEPGRGEIFEIPVDVEFSWSEECFAVMTRNRLSLAEIVSDVRNGER